MRGVDPSSHLLTTDDQNRVLAGRGDGGVVENERPMYAWKAYEHVIVIVIVAVTMAVMHYQRHAYEGRSGVEKVKSEKENT